MENELLGYMGAKIKHLRKSAGFSQDEVAGILQLTRASICNLEKGRQSPSVDTVFRICAIYQVTPNDLFPPIPRVKFETVRTEVLVPKTIEKLKMQILP